MDVDYKRFKIFMLENDIKQKDIADLLDITSSTLSKKLNRQGADFTAREIRIMCNYYKISADEYFF